MKQKVITLVIILLTFFSILSANFQIIDSLSDGQFLQAKTIFSSGSTESQKMKKQDDKGCVSEKSLAGRSNFALPGNVIYFILK